MVYDEHDQLGDVRQTVETIRWFVPERPVEGTISVINADSETLDIDR